MAHARLQPTAPAGALKIERLSPQGRRSSAAGRWAASIAISGSIFQRCTKLLDNEPPPSMHLSLERGKVEMLSLELLSCSEQD
jgi:hypothetical protein